MNRFKTPVLFAICIVFLSNCNQSKFYYSPRPASSADIGTAPFGETGIMVHQTAFQEKLAQHHADYLGDSIMTSLSQKKVTNYMIARNK